MAVLPVVTVEGRTFDVTAELLRQHGLVALPAAGQIVLNPKLLPGYAALAPATEKTTLRNFPSPSVEVVFSGVSAGLPADGAAPCQAEPLPDWAASASADPAVVASPIDPRRFRFGELHLDSSTSPTVPINATFCHFSIGALFTQKSGALISSMRVHDLRGPGGCSASAYCSIEFEAPNRSVTRITYLSSRSAVVFWRIGTGVVADLLQVHVHLSEKLGTNAGTSSSAILFTPQPEYGLFNSTISVTDATTVNAFNEQPISLIAITSNGLSTETAPASLLGLGTLNVTLRNVFVVDEKSASPSPTAPPAMWIGCGASMRLFASFVNLTVETIGEGQPAGGGRGGLTVQTTRAAGLLEMTDVTVHLIGVLPMPTSLAPPTARYPAIIVQDSRQDTLARAESAHQLDPTFVSSAIVLTRVRTNVTLVHAEGVGPSVPLHGTEATGLWLFCYAADGFLRSISIMESSFQVSFPPATKSSPRFAPLHITGPFLAELKLVDVNVTLSGASVTKTSGAVFTSAERIVMIEGIPGNVTLTNVHLSKLASVETTPSPPTGTLYLNGFAFLSIAAQYPRSWLCPGTSSCPSFVIVRCSIDVTSFATVRRNVSTALVGIYINGLIPVIAGRDGVAVLRVVNSSSPCAIAFLGRAGPERHFGDIHELSFDGNSITTANKKPTAGCANPGSLFDFDSTIVFRRIDTLCLQRSSVDIATALSSEAANGHSHILTRTPETEMTSLSVTDNDVRVRYTGDPGSGGTVTFVDLAQFSLNVSDELIIRRNRFAFLPLDPANVAPAAGWPNPKFAALHGFRFFQYRGGNSSVVMVDNDVRIDAPTFDEAGVVDTHKDPAAFAEAKSLVFADNRIDVTARKPAGLDLVSWYFTEGGTLEVARNVVSARSTDNQRAAGLRYFVLLEDDEVGRPDVLSRVTVAHNAVHVSALRYPGIDQYVPRAWLLAGIGTEGIQVRAPVHVRRTEMENNTITSDTDFYEGRAATIQLRMCAVEEALSVAYNRATIVERSNGPQVPGYPQGPTHDYATGAALVFQVGKPLASQVNAAPPSVEIRGNRVNISTAYRSAQGLGFEEGLVAGDSPRCNFAGRVTRQRAGEITVASNVVDAMARRNVHHLNNDLASGLLMVSTPVSMQFADMLKAPVNVNSTSNTFRVSVVRDAAAEGHATAAGVQLRPLTALGMVAASLAPALFTVTSTGDDVTVAVIDGTSPGAWSTAAFSNLNSAVGQTSMFTGSFNVAPSTTIALESTGRALGFAIPATQQANVSIVVQAMTFLGLATGSAAFNGTAISVGGPLASGFALFAIGGGASVLFRHDVTARNVKVAVGSEAQGALTVLETSNATFSGVNIAMDNVQFASPIAAVLKPRLAVALATEPAAPPTAVAGQQPSSLVLGCVLLSKPGSDWRFAPPPADRATPSTLALWARGSLFASVPQGGCPRPTATSTRTSSLQRTPSLQRTETPPLTHTVPPTHSPTAASRSRGSSGSATASPRGTPSVSRHPTVSVTVHRPTPVCDFSAFTVAVAGGSVGEVGGTVAVFAADINRGSVVLTVTPVGATSVRGNLFAAAAARRLDASAVDGPQGERRAGSPSATGLAAQWGSLVSARVSGNGSLVLSVGGNGTAGEHGRVTLVVREYVRVSFGAGAFECEIAPGSPVPQAFVVAVEPERLAALAAAEEETRVAAASTAAAAGLAGSAAAASDAQTLAALSLVQCGSAAGQSASGQMSMLLALVPLGSDGMSEAERGVVGNTVLLTCLIALQLCTAAGLRVFAHVRARRGKRSAAATDGDGDPTTAITTTTTTTTSGGWVAAFATVRFPSMALTAGQLQLPGTALLSVSMILAGNVSAVALLGCLTTAAVPGVVGWTSAYRGRQGTFLRGRTGLSFFAYTEAARCVPWVSSGSRVAAVAWRWLGPVGRWGPKEPAAMFGGPVRQLRGAWRGLGLATSAQSVLVAVIAAMPAPRGPLCALQFGALAVVTVAVPAVLFVAAPYRVRGLGALRLGSGICAGVSIAASGWLAGTQTGAAPAVDPTALHVLGASSLGVAALAMVQLAIVLCGKVVAKRYLADDGRSVPFLERQSDGAAAPKPHRPADVELARLSAFEDL